MPTNVSVRENNDSFEIKKNMRILAICATQIDIDFSLCFWVTYGGLGFCPFLVGLFPKRFTYLLENVRIAATHLTWSIDRLDFWICHYGWIEEKKEN